ncbi:hypothetical protein [Lacisediminihabitans sp.]|uniref:hypothetical protein n=1 Tax=Lacisediminihabitans sp. TaxID=2787631 RepID=UPI00374D14B3
MYFAGVVPEDFPPPPTVDEIAESFMVPVMSLSRQPSLVELDAGSTGSSVDGSPVTLDSVSLSYTLYRNHDDREDPANLASLGASEREALHSVPLGPLPEWMRVRRALMRFPTLWEAVMTTRTRHVPNQAPQSTLVDHANHILTNLFREERVRGGFPGELDSPVTERHIDHVAVSVDGIDVPGMRIDTDPHVFAVGAALGDRILTAVVARDHLPFVTLAFVTRCGSRK